MTELTASRTLVKSPPELWAECSDAASLSRHLDGFGEIRITRLEPETVVAWEGEAASGVVRLEPSGWGTKVVLTAHPVPVDLPAPAVEEPVVEAAVAPAEPAAEEAVTPVEPVAEEAVAPAEPVAEEPPRPGALARLLGLFRRRRAPEPPPEVAAAPDPDAEREPGPEAEREPEPEAGREPEPEAEREPEPESPPQDQPPAVVLELMALEQALDSLGQAHHRPFSRA